MPCGVEFAGDLGEFDELLLVRCDGGWLWGAAGGFVDLDEVFAQCGGVGVFAVGTEPSGCALDGGSEGCAFGAFEADGFGVEDGGADFPPDGALASSAGETDLAGLYSEVTEALESVTEAEGDAFHGCACHDLWGHGFSGEAVEDAGAVRKVWGAFAGEVGKKEEALGACGNGSHRVFERGVVPVEEVPDLFRCDGDIHGADERHPLICGVAECGDLAVFVDDGFG